MKRRQTTQIRRVLQLVAAVLVLILPSSAQKPAPSGPEHWNPRTFRAGEKLEYRISWASLMTAATAELTVRERRPFYGHEAFHFQALARTVEFARSLYELDDQFDSYGSTETLVSFRYEAYVHEQNKRENSVVRMSGEGLPVQNDGPMVKVLPGTRDPLGVLYYLRAIDWARQSEARVPVFNGRRLFEVHARSTKSGKIEVAAGTYTASCVELRVFERRKEMSNVRIWIWFAQDESHTPALMEAEMPFGKLRIELVRASLTQAK